MLIFNTFAGAAQQKTCIFNAYHHANNCMSNTYCSDYTYNAIYRLFLLKVDLIFQMKY